MRDLIDRLWIRVYIAALEVAAFASERLRPRTRHRFRDRVRSRLAEVHRVRRGDLIGQDGAGEDAGEG
jgi:hypothetical protein